MSITQVIIIMDIYGQSLETEIRNHQMGLIPDPSHTSLPEYRGNIKTTRWV